MQRLSLFRTALIALVAAAACGGGSAPVAPGGVPSRELKTLVDLTTGLEVTSGGTGTWNYAGQSFLIGDKATYDHLRFHWYTFQRTPAAFGTLTLLTQEYLGLPRDLSPTTPGFVARSTRIEANVYVFGETVSISGAQRYWAYTDINGAFAASFDQDIYSGGDMYVTGVESLPFRKAAASGRMVNGVLVPPPSGVYVDANFKLQAIAR